MAKVKQDPELIEKWRRRIHDALPVTIAQETRAVAAAVLAAGQHWKPSRTSSDQPQEEAQAANVSVDRVGPIIRHCASRLRVWDFEANFQSPSGTVFGPLTPDYGLKLQLVRHGYLRWLPLSHLSEVYGDTSDWRVVSGSATMGRRFVTGMESQDECGPVKLQLPCQTHLVLDPLNPSQRLHNHQWMCDVRVMETSRFNEDYAFELKRAGLPPMEGGLPANVLMSTEFMLAGSGMFYHRVGAPLSTTPCLLVLDGYEKDEKGRSKDVLVYRPAYHIEKNYRVERIPEQWYVLESGPWHYGNPYLKLDYWTDYRSATGLGLALSLLPMQNVSDLMAKAEIGDVLLSSAVKFVVAGNTLDSDEDESTLRSNEPFGIVRVKGGIRAADAIHPLQFKRMDGAESAIMAKADEAMYAMAGVQPIMQGQGLSHEPAMSFGQRLQQALVPLEGISGEDYLRAQEWLGETMDYGLWWHAYRTGPKAFIKMYGEQFAGPMFDEGDPIKRCCDSGRVVCKLRESAFKPEPLEAVEARIDRWVTAGRFDPKDPQIPIMLFLATGRELSPGLADIQFAALMKVRRIMDSDKRVEIEPYDPHDWIMYYCSYYTQIAESHGFTKPTVNRLQLAIEDCKREEFATQRQEAAKRMLQDPQVAAMMQQRQSGGAGPTGTSTGGVATGPSPGQGPMVLSPQPAANGPMVGQFSGQMATR